MFYKFAAVAIEKINIEKFLELAKNHPVIDVRSPSEFDHAHIPEAINIPLFTDEERKIVGTAYKQESREKAIKIGLDFFGPKMKIIVEEVERIGSRDSGTSESSSQSKFLIPTSKILLIYCWRGGMRSAAIAWLMDLYGFKVFTLIGGYKKFRNYVLDAFSLPFRFNILGGFTGSGKTEMLKALRKHGETIIDLEDLAKHKGSAFGNIKMPKQPTQEMFENLLAQELRDKSAANNQWKIEGIQHPPIWLEDESQRIGDINLPNEFWKTMRQSPVYFIDVPFEKRLKQVVEEYGSLEKEKLLYAIIRIEKRLGGLETKNAINFLIENNTVESFRILLKYYDKYYLKSLHNRDRLDSLLNKIPFENVSIHNADVLLQQVLST